MTPIPYNQLKGQEIDAMVAKILGVEPSRDYAPDFEDDYHGKQLYYPPYHSSVDACLEELVTQDFYIQIERSHGMLAHPWNVVLYSGKASVHATGETAAKTLCIAILRFSGKEITL